MNIVKVFEQSGISQGVQFFDDPSGKWDFGVSAADLADVLGISDPCFLPCSPEYVSLKGSRDVHTTLPFDGVPVIVWEPGLYEVISRSRAKNAKIFQKWLWEEVIPSIRKTGGYGQSKLSKQQEMIVALTNDNYQLQNDLLERCHIYHEPSLMPELPRMHLEPSCALVQQEIRETGIERHRGDVFMRWALESECINQINKNGCIKTGDVWSAINFGAVSEDHKTLDWVKDEVERLLGGWNMGWVNPLTRTKAVWWADSAK